ncbi:hypothetical protein [Aureimonas pseudogalii]|uniref:Uncharacterized protein n=1 Tax=Aureimonas pseudogalii TaxID=1744844 RepID=A0A7W6E8U3_9HYPH|nr:hypothetical protein [Aureimonas pseudogalii]MBB3996877.1 hypothetical protein [Aureimonas pseudogalii]
MSKRVLFNEAEIAEPGDFDDAALFPTDAVDSLIDDAIAYPAHWAAMTVSATANSQEVRVSAGRYFEGRVVYELDASVDVNLLTQLPTVASDERWVALILRGSVETLAENRAFETSTDPEVSTPVVRSVPKVEARRLGIVVQQGLATPAPAQKPVVAETDCCIAFVRLKSSGVQEIVTGEGWRVKSLYEVEGRVTAIEVNLSALFRRTSALETDLAALAAKLNGLPVPRPEIIRQMRRDIAALRIKGDVPEGARSDFYDPGLVPDQWDFGQVAGYTAQFRVREGVQFPYSNVKIERMEVVGEDNPLINFRGRRMMPAWDEILRIENTGSGGTRDISSVVHSVVTAIQRTVAMSSVSYGPTINVCENAAEWSAVGQAAHAGSSFNANGAAYQTVGLVVDNGYTPDGYVPGHQVFAVQQIQHHSWTETYWDYITETFGFNGSVYGQTFLVANPMIATSVEIQFTKIGTEGGVKLALCETDPTGAPVVERVLAWAEKTPTELAAGGTGWKKFAIPMTFLTPGRRYAWFTVTTGNHQLQGSTANRFTGGTSFRLTDGAWAQGDQDFDFNFRVNAARFRHARTVVAFKPITLDGGMTEFRLFYPNWVPGGTKLEWEIRPFYGNGVDSDWVKLEPKDPNPLSGLPALVELRCTMLATQDLGPMIELTDKATVLTARVGNVLQAITKVLNLGLTTTTFQTLTYLDDFNDDIHNFNPRIMAGAAANAIGTTLIAPDVSTVTVLDRPEHVAVLSTYTVPAGTRFVRLAPGGNTTSITDIFFIQNIAGFAL